MNTPESDAVVAGGGLVGATAALALARAGLAVRVVDARAPDSAADGRASSVAYAPFRMWRALGLGPALEPHAQPVRAIVVETGPGLGRAAAAAAASALAFSQDDLYGEARARGEPLGWLVENARAQAALDAALAEAGVEVVAPARVAGVEADGHAATVRLEDGRALTAPLVVGAEGRRSAVREAAGIGVSRAGYGQTGISATLELERPHGGVARQVFAPGGPLALLPLTGGRASLVWSAPDAQAQALMAMDAGAFEALLLRRFGEAVGRLSLAGPRRAFPLGVQLADALTGPRTVLAGDAAHAVHPIAGQGLNLGLKDAAALAEVAADARRLGEDWGSDAVLERYARWRRFDRAALGVGVDLLARTLSAPRGPLRALGGAALAAAAAVAPARRLFAREAGGGLGELPRLLRGEPV
ncbi:MAG: FAD-dependent monooxygenase [Caulobacteraceae bacterium]|nr:FAD-dependent monooxygenase [Caulobacter sp.]